MRIAFLAMSGVRACDPELLRLGLTLPGFVERSRTIASLPSLGLLTLAAMTPEEHEVTYHEVDSVDELPASVEQLLATKEPEKQSTQSPRKQLVAISTFTAQAPEAYRLADRFRAAGVRVAMGGLHVTACPDEAQLHADAVVVGEGEPVWPTLVADAAAGRLQPRYDARGTEWDLGATPIPRYDLLDMDRYNRITVQTTRGCPFACEFCASSILLTPRYKQKPVERVLAEVDAVCEHWAGTRPFLEFADDNSFVNRRWWMRFLPQMAERNTRWFTETDARIGDDDALLEQLVAAGCKEVLIGLESPTAAGLPAMERKADFKLKALDAGPRRIRNLQSHGIRVNGCFILGLDGQTPAVFDEVERYANELGLFDVQITLQTPFPGTPLYERLAATGRLLEPHAWHRCTLFDLTYRPDPMTAEQLVGGLHGLAERLYSREATAARRASFRDQARRGRRSRRSGGRVPAPAD